MDSTRELSRIELVPRGDGLSDCYLRRNITSEEVTDENGVTQTVWSADEVYFTTDKSADEIEALFDALWTEAEKMSMTDSERIVQNESDILDVQEGIVEIYEMLIAGGV